MKNISSIIAIIFAVFLLPLGLVWAHGGDAPSDTHTAQEEAEGKALWEKLQAGEKACADFSDDDFAALGEYFMGQMFGEQHEAMNNMMTQMMGGEGEKQMHIVMGKRMSGCEPEAQAPKSMMGGGMMDGGMMPMMMQNGMMGGYPAPWQTFAWRNSLSSWLVTLLYFVWLVVGILAAIWLWRQIRK